MDGGWLLRIRYCPIVSYYILQMLQLQASSKPDKPIYLLQKKCRASVFVHTSKYSVKLEGAECGSVYGARVSIRMRGTYDIERHSVKIPLSRPFRSKLIEIWPIIMCILIPRHCKWHLACEGPSLLLEYCYFYVPTQMQVPT